MERQSRELVQRQERLDTRSRNFEPEALRRVREQNEQAYNRYAATRNPDDVPYRFRTQDRELKEDLAELLFGFHRARIDDDRKARMRDMGRAFVRASDDASARNETEEAYSARDIAFKILEFIAENNPISQTALSIYTATTGFDYLTGQPVSTAVRAFAIVDVALTIADIYGLGSGSVLKSAYRMVDKAGESALMRRFVREGIRDSGKIKLHTPINPGPLHDKPVNWRENLEYY